MLDERTKQNAIDCYLTLLTSRSVDGIKNLTGKDCFIPNEFDEIESMPGYELNQLKQVLIEKIDISVSAENEELSFCVKMDDFKKAISMAKSRALEEHLIKEFMKRGATNDCLHSLFGLNPRTKLHYVELYGIKGESGRPTKKHAEEIIDVFLGLNESIDFRQRLLMASMAVNVNISSVWSVVNEHLHSMEELEKSIQTTARIRR